jgi:hypothetical protein
MWNNSSSLTLDFNLMLSLGLVAMDSFNQLVKRYAPSQLEQSIYGQLEPPKCFYYLLHWVFDSEGYARLVTPEELDIQISLRQSADDQEIDITQRSCTTFHRALG